MILHPPILALVLASLIGCGLIAWASLFAWRLLARWDLASGAESQIALERRTYLVSTVMAFVMAMQIGALVLFVFNADRMAAMFVGAMCAVGTLNASAYGFPALYAKMAMFFAASLWLVADHVDGRGRDYPLTRFKYRLLLAIAPLAVVEAGLSLAYFLDLKADTLTSCCGSLFTPNKAGIAAEMAGFDAGSALGLIAAALLLAGGTGLAAGSGRLPAGLLRAASLAHGAASLFVFGAAMIAIVSALSLYVYEHPHHHCPFCILKREYGYVGFALYLPLFAGTALGAGGAMLRTLPLPASLSVALPSIAGRLARASVAAFALFAAVAAAIVWRSGLILIGG